MNKHKIMSKTALAAAIAVLVGSAAGVVNATDACGDFGDCKVLVEINSSDGDIGFHFLMDGDSLIYGALFNPHHRKIFAYFPRRELRKQTSTELFQESAEPPCSEDVAEEGDDVVTLEDFLDRWKAGTYKVFGINSDWERQFGQSTLSFNLPAAPAKVQWVEELDDGELEYEITWEEGDDLGECSEGMELLPMPPKDVPVAIWEVVLEVDIDEEDIETPEDQAVADSKYVVRLPGDADELEIEVPDDFLESLPDDTPAKVEVGAIGFDDNATFTEIGDICLNEDEGC